jgi:hypothetical protein
LPKNKLHVKHGHVGGNVFLGKGFGQRAGCLTKRAPDVWDSAAFSSIFLASSFPCSQAESTPAHPPLTLAVGTPLASVRNIGGGF